MPDISKWNISNAICLQSLFFNCSSLISLPDISKWDLFNFNINTVHNYEPDFEFNTKFLNEKNIQSVLSSPHLNKSYDNDIYLDNIEFKIPKLKSYKLEEMKKILLERNYNMKFLFAGCSSLKELPDISKWDLKNTKNISCMFAGCTSLIYLPDISKWKTQNILNMSGLFYNCSSLKSLPDISKWNMNNVNDILAMFYKCSSLESLPDISKWEFK